MAIDPPAIHSWRSVALRVRRRRLHARGVASTLLPHRPENGRAEQKRFGVVVSSWVKRRIPVCFRLRTPLYMLHVRQNTSNPMPGEILNAPAPPRSTAPAARTLPKRLLYSIFARIGGSGLDTDAFETLRASSRG